MYWVQAQVKPRRSLHKTVALGSMETKYKPNRGGDTTGPMIVGPSENEKTPQSRDTSKHRGEERVGTSSLIGKIEHGQTTQISEDEVLGYKDLPVDAYKFSVLL